MRTFVLVCIGGAVGTGARYLLQGWALEVLGPSFPWGTFAVNTIGSYLLAIVMYGGIEAATISPTMRLVLGTGVMGGFTTYSTFSYETMRYLQVGSWGLAVANVLATTVVCLAACLAGWATGRWMFAS